jgi:hypothetical protein
VKVKVEFGFGRKVQMRENNYFASFDLAGFDVSLSYRYRWSEGKVFCFLGFAICFCA